MQVEILRVVVYPAILVWFTFFNHQSTFAQGELVYIPFDKTIDDSSQFLHRVNTFGNPGFSEDRFGNPCGARYFNGVTDYLTINHSSIFNRISRALSVVCWVKIAQSDFNWLTLVCKGEAASESPNNPHFRVQALQALTQSTISIGTEFTEFDDYFYANPYPKDTWFMYTLTYDGRTVRSFINDRVVWAFPYVGTLYSNSARLYIGRDIPGADEFFIGSMDELRIFDRALTEQQVRQMHLNGRNTTKAVQNKILCDSIISATADQGSCFTKIDFSTPSVTQDCKSPSVILTKGLASGSDFPVGKTSLVFSVSNPIGAVSTCTTIVAVSDFEPPVINCPDDTIISFTGSFGDSVYFAIETPTGTDNCKLDRIDIIGRQNINNCWLNSGTHVFEFEAVDINGNKARCRYTVHVDIIPLPIPQPTADTSSGTPSTWTKLACPSDIYQNNDAGECGAIIDFPFPGKPKTGLESGSFFPVGITNNVFTDSIGKEICAFRVHVEDKEPPAFECPKDTFLQANHPMGFYGSFPIPRANDQCKLDTAYQIGGVLANTVFPFGTTTMSYLAKDSSGNLSVCTYKVHVIQIGDSAVIPKKTSLDMLHGDSIILEKPLVFSVKKLTVVIYDNSMEDNDTVSVYYNGKEIVARECIRRIEKTPIIREIELATNSDNILFVKAWNTGKYSPNTLQVDFFDANIKRASIKSLRRKRPVWSRNMSSKPGVSPGIPLEYNTNK